MNIDAPDTTIRNVIPGNFLRKNLIDLLIVTSNEMQFYVSNESLNFSFAISIPIMSMTQPLVLDIDGDYYNDIIYNNATTGEKMVAIYNSSSDNYSYIEFSTFVDESCLTDDVKMISKRKLSTPHSSAFIDFDGDLYSDLMLLTSNGTNYMEIWTRSKKNPPRYCLNTENEIPTNASQFSVEDMNQDGMVDVIFAIPIRHDDYTITEKIIILNNQLTSMRDGNTAFIKNKPIFKSILDPTANSSASYTLNPAYFNSTLYATEYRPRTMKMFDFDNNGYPDVVATLTNPLTNDRNTYIFFNYKDALDINKTVIAINDSSVILATPFDLYEDGIFDLLIVKNNVFSSSISILHNDAVTDSMFLKVMALEDQYYGEIVYGVNFQFEQTDLEGNRHIRCGCQMPQNAYLTLQLPYALKGIARSNNFIENLIVEYSSSTSLSRRTYSPVIPNSQIIIMPKRLEPYYWSLELFVSPSSKLFAILLWCIIVLGIIVVLVLLIYLKEKSDDKKAHFWGGITE